MAESPECSIPDAPTRLNSGILTPTSEASLEHIDGLSCSRKRKRGIASSVYVLDDSFTIRPHPSTVTTKPRTLRPIALLHRANLPLSCLDLTQPARHNLLPQVQTFEGHVRVLELESRMSNEPMVLVALLDDHRTHYAVEMTTPGLYTLCRLGSWMNIDALCRTAVVARQLQPPLRKDSPVPTLRTPAHMFKVETPASAKQAQKKRLAIEAIQSMVTRPSIELQAMSDIPAVVQPDPQPPHATSIVANTGEPGLLNEQHQTCAEILSNVRVQYFEALYISKASLAYFAKGPLSRARAAFHLDYDSALDMKDLIGFLSSIVLSPNMLDKKYRDGVPGVLSSIEMHDDSEADTVAKKKQRKSKKMKIGKTGLFPLEAAKIRQWWKLSEDDASATAPGHTVENIIQKRAAALRVRETQLQIILILETIALQQLLQVSELGSSALPTDGNPVAPDSEPAVPSKKAHDLAMLIDVYVDRLCIWQSIATEDCGVSHDLLNRSGVQENHAADVLREFCVEVVMPFYSTRLPEQCAMISRKLGGPSLVSPKRPQLKKSTSISALTRPGAVAKRPTPATTDRSLRRILTNERHNRSMSRDPARAISLMRSATAPSVMTIKREASESPSLSSVPSLESQPSAASRSGIAKARSFTSREVDLNYLANTNARVKKADAIEAELRSAIAGLKKPNRQLVGQEIMASKEQRALGAGVSRKSKKSAVRNPLLNVQILATPKAQRQKDMFSQAQVMPQEEQTIDWVSAVPPSSARIPQSSIRPASWARPAIGNASSQLHASHSETTLVESTPSRSFPRSKLSDIPVPQSSPVRPRMQSLNVPRPIKLPPVSVFDIENERTITSKSKLEGLSVEDASHEDNRAISPELGVESKPVWSTGRSENEEDEGIDLYKALGWDDYDNNDD